MKIGDKSMKLSIIVPVYNTSEFLASCLDSVIYPNLEDYEVIIVNDGSTDNSPEIAREYVEKHPGLFRLINKENGGLGDARNVGIEAATGEFLLFLDSDDKMAPGSLNEIDEIIDGSSDICIFDFQQTNIDGDHIGVINGSERRGRFSLEEYPQLLFQAPAACNKIIRRSLFMDSGIRFPGRVWFEDLRTIPKLYPLAKKIFAVDKKWYLYLMRSGSITNSNNTGRNLEIIDSVDEILNFFKAQGQFDKYAAELEYMAFYNQFLTSGTRVNLIQWNSPIQKQLSDNYTAKFPKHLDNPYVQAMPTKYKLLEKFIRKHQYIFVHALMKANNIVKNKKL